MRLATIHAVPKIQRTHSDHLEFGTHPLCYENCTTSLANKFKSLILSVPLKQHCPHLMFWIGSHADQFSLCILISLGDKFDSNFVVFHTNQKTL